jgi:CubicO group peptidase (beta-lactamase class C family)
LVAARRHSPAWGWLCGAAAGVALLLVGLWSGDVLRVKTKHGTILVEKVPANADVEVDGETVTLTRNHDVVTLTLLAEGPHRLKVVQQGQEIWSSNAMVKLGGDPVVLKVEPQRKPGDGNVSPVSGQAAPGGDPLDKVMLKYLQKIGCPGTALAISRKGVPIYARGYGWTDSSGKVAVQPFTPMAIAGCERPFTRAAIRQLARTGKLDLEAGVFKLLKIEPRGAVVDERIWNITVRHLLENSMGWQGDPWDHALLAARANGLKDPIPVEAVLPFVMGLRLQDTPGTRSSDCNESYQIMRLIVSRATNLSYAEYVRRELVRPEGVEEPGGIEGIGKTDIRASAPAMCAFMSRFWLTGEPRDDGNPTWQMNGIWHDATAMMLWRPDGVDVAFVFNGRSPGVSHDDIKDELEKAIEALLKAK